ncbi:MAG: hypothetical protein ACJ70P_05965 [Nitrososphaera sp.]
MESPNQRPLGVIIIAALAVIGGIIFLATGLFLLIIGIGFIFLALGIAYMVMAYGLWNGRGWAWTITLILSVIGIIVALVSIGAGNFGAGEVINIIINGIVIYYLYRPNVKTFFGK